MKNRTIEDTGIERREEKRAFFTLERGVSALITPSGNGSGSGGKPVPVTLLSISSGGISFLGIRYKFPKLKPGDRLTISDVRAPQPLGTINWAEIEVKYVVDYDKHVRMAFGCAFTDIPEDCYQKILYFVNQWLIKMGVTIE